MVWGRERALSPADDHIAVLKLGPLTPNAGLQFSGQRAWIDSLLLVQHLERVYNAGYILADTLKAVLLRNRLNQV